MDHFNYKKDGLYAEDVPLSEIAEQYGTPCYVYSRATLERHWHAFDNALGEHPHKICYAVKANSNIAVLNIMARLGSGFDIVSGGELARVLAAGGDPSKIVFSGVGKTEDEITAALDAGIFCFNVESKAGLETLQTVAERENKTAPISLRINPNVDANTHPYIATGLKENKFGIPAKDAIDLYQYAAGLSNIKILGIDCHIGSQLTKLAPFLEALDELMRIVDELAAREINIEHIDVGGGLGVRYCDEQPPQPDAYARALKERLQPRKLEIILEPGRAIAANAGVLLTKVLSIKPTGHKKFAIVDSAMNDLLRPALYQAWQQVVPLQKREDAAWDYYDVVGPVCETADFLAKDRQLAIKADDVLAIRSAGAYGFVMSSNYNSRPRAAEVMVDGNKTYLIRERETVADLFNKEKLLPE